MSRIQYSAMSTSYGGGAFLVIFFLNFGSCGRLSWLNCQAVSFRAHVNIVSLLTYLLTYLLTQKLLNRIFKNFDGKLAHGPCHGRNH